ncbi:propeptide, PepSY and peptidase M4 [Clostridium aceticum]|uniref:Propeptide, PepSY and peptidase M4 n=1 Tax=Clostridium aceticum TaxID=84022 RepID=A0A0D8IHR7_9CLOT|nr:YcdB/YcdC domain-containing protein [Clostridium aceticum]AKL93868.1 propeptide, PepSY and peptidase M4 [Clostridium aceticum]KJF28736.1 hypothetical protein TZ02_02230 [Clostridium aceticum]
MKKYTKAILVTLLIGSIGVNLIYYRDLKNANEKIGQVNTVTASNVESNIRQSIMYMQELIEEQSPEALQNLETSVITLAFAFNHWVDLNQSNKIPNERMQKALGSIEALRNTISHHLDRQYKTNENQLMKYDIDMLEAMQDQLKRLSLAYHSIEDRLVELKNPVANDGGLIQIANSIEEISKLYRHSQLPNKHPKYISYGEVVLFAEDKMPFLKNLELRDDDQQVFIRDGVHYYQLSYYEGEEEVYLIWMDAIHGNIRNFETKQNASEGKDLVVKEALDIARKFLTMFYKEEVKEEVFYIESQEKEDAVYSFRFTPLRNGMQIVSDAYIVNISADSGKILKFTNDFTNTRIEDDKETITEEEVQEKFRKDFGDMQYNGLAIVRSFYTRYQPKLTHSYRIEQNQQPVMVFIDIDTGMLVHKMYYIYHPVSQ